MAGGRSFAQQVAGDGLVVGSFVQSLLPTESTVGLDDAEAAIIQSRTDVLSRGGALSNGPSSGAPNASSSRLEEANYTLKAVATPPARMYIQSVDFPDRIIRAQFNPDRFRDMITTHWNRFDIPGYSQQPLQYGYTTNARVEFELLFDAGKSQQPIPINSVVKLKNARRQLKAWHLLRENSGAIGGIGETQRLLFVWPNFGSMTCILTSTSFEYETFNSIGQVTSFRAQIQLEEIRDEMVYAEKYETADPFEGDL